jgi:hypothetical protein
MAQYHAGLVEIRVAFDRLHHFIQIHVRATSPLPADRK